MWMWKVVKGRTIIAGFYISNSRLPEKINVIIRLNNNKYTFNCMNGFKNTFKNTIIPDTSRNQDKMKSNQEAL